MGDGLMYGSQPYVRSRILALRVVVHLWVEGIFEVFFVAVISFLFVKLGLVRGQDSHNQRIVRDHCFLSGGILKVVITSILSAPPWPASPRGQFLGAEVVPLALIGMEAMETWQQSRATPWMKRYKWPIMFFMASTGIWWGLSLFGFLINTPDRALLHAGSEPHPVARAHGPVWRLRDAGYRSDAVLPAGPS
ncbi:MAG: hypothetical protein R3C40_02550 [Parvularculaceae bacterium]